MMFRKDSFVLLIISIIFFVGCGSADENGGAKENENLESSQEVIQEQDNTQDAYPESVNASNNDGAYPVENSTSNDVEPYPVKQPDPANTLNDPYPASEDTSGVLLAINKPISAGNTMINGVGPAGMPIIILNITFVGEQLGAGVINEDGTFSIPVVPIPAGVRIGVTADSNVIDALEVKILPGEGEISIPRVGYFYDSVVIPSDG